MLHTYMILYAQLFKKYHRARVALDTLHLIPRKSQSPHQGLQSPTWSDSLSLAFSSPSSLPLASQTRPTSLLLFSQYAKWVPSLGFLYCPFPPLGHSTYRYPLINCLTSFKTLLTCHFLNKTYADHPTKNCNSPPHAHTFLIPVILPYFCTVTAQFIMCVEQTNGGVADLKTRIRMAPGLQGQPGSPILPPREKAWLAERPAAPGKFKVHSAVVASVSVPLAKPSHFSRLPLPPEATSVFWSIFFF